MIKKIRRDKPLTSEIEYKKTRAAINKENRDRSKRHERRVAQLLGGNRTPMSGGHAAYKGDVEILFSHNPGKYIIECKMSTSLKDGIPQIGLAFNWLPKIRKEAKAMNARFSIIVLHYFNQDFLKDFVLISNDDFKAITLLDGVDRDKLEYIRLNGPIIDIRTKVGNKERKTYTINQRYATRAMVDLLGILTLKYITPAGVYTMMHLNDFRELLKGA
jgi:hypothetical protein